MSTALPRAVARTTEKKIWIRSISAKRSTMEITMAQKTWKQAGYGHLTPSSEKEALRSEIDNLMTCVTELVHNRDLSAQERIDKIEALKNEIYEKKQRICVIKSEQRGEIIAQELTRINTAKEDQHEIKEQAAKEEDANKQPKDPHLRTNAAPAPSSGPAFRP